MATEKTIRRGSVYIIVLGSAMAVTVIGLSALTVVRITRRSAQETAGLAQARLHARTAIEMGLHQIASVPNWRNTFPNGTWLKDQPIGTGTYTLDGIDPNDADLTDDESDPLVLTGTGVQGEARYELQVTLQAKNPPLSCLEVSLCAGNDIILNTPATVSGNQIISANNSIATVGNSCVVNPAAEAVIAISGSGFNGGMTTGITPRAMPDPATVFDYYIANGTTINLGSLPASVDNSVRYLRKLVLSPTSNPHGAINAEGIYIIDCLGVSVVIEECRIVGTLVLRNPGSATGIFKPVNWEPAVSNYPALMVEGSFLFETFDSSLSEASTGVNFNPVGTPYLGITDAVLDDTYPNLIDGLVYIGNDAGDNSSFTRTAIDGVLVVGNSLTLTPSSNQDPVYFDLTYDGKYHQNPPPGFSDPPWMKITEGSWARIVN